ncbi:uncharacterized protein LOC112654356 [Canis lupus dingo]|uniref:uncharacterized protein LOC112654356 n=1 Tax=Canis lupus dingo TaxID=286419 RepID=UPI0003ADA028|nr:uncharacterized protein LOC112654356 [Canis lupus dingo]|eukprot:XP_022259194.1 uncharacterized protein LOC111090086 [Canis lupus familiaris]
MGTEVSRADPRVMQSDASPTASPIASRNRIRVSAFAKTPLVTLNEHRLEPWSEPSCNWCRMKWAERPAAGRCSGDGHTHAAETNRPYFAAGEMKMIYQHKRMSHDPKYTVGQTEGRSLPRGLGKPGHTGPVRRGKHPLGPLWHSSPASHRSGLRGWRLLESSRPTCSEALRPPHRRPVLQNTDGPDDEGASGFLSGKNTGNSRPHYLTLYYILGMPLVLHHFSPNLWLSFSF